MHNMPVVVDVVPVLLQLRLVGGGRLVSVGTPGERQQCQETAASNRGECPRDSTAAA
jgi:hypothetical protein